LAASEFVGTSLIVGEHERAVAAAEFIRDDANPAFQALASRTLGRVSPPNPGGLSQDFDLRKIQNTFRDNVAEAKLRVTRDPRNAIAWADLARRYTALGQIAQADKSLRIARALAPTSRYLLRSAARFLVHIGRPDEAVAVLQESPRTPDDPWLMSALLSVAATSKLPVRGVRNAHRIIDRGKFRPIEISELESELATMELQGGADRKARSLFRQSLNAPTDNSLAQIEWASHRLTTLEVEPEHMDVPFAAEALSRSAAQDGQWDTALRYGIEWMDDQPFDAQAAIYASYIATVGVDEWQTGVVLADFGLRANSSNLTLLNNMAYALIELGEYDRARGFLDRAIDATAEHSDRVALYATRGLLQFRLGHFDEGRRLYHQGIAYARSVRAVDSEAMARSMLIREEVTIGIADALDPETREFFARVAKQTKDPGVRRCIDRALSLT
jgi:Tfp pilus assembly protein PilF